MTQDCWARRPRSVTALACGCIALLCVATLAPADEPAKPAAGIDTKLVEQVERALRALDDDSFEVRDQAAAELEKLAQTPDLRGYLAERFGRLLRSAETSFEVRTRIAPLVRQLPAPPAAPADLPEAPSIATLLDQLHGDSSVEREAAARQLEGLLEHTELIAPVWLELKRRAADPALSARGRRALWPLLDRARRAWLAADAEKVPMPPLTAGQVTGWIDQALARPATAVEEFRRQLAERELLDALVRDESRALTVDLLKVRMEQVDDATRSTLEQIAEYAEPAMGAEVWASGENIWVQFLVIGLPQHNPDTARATHFDHIDDETAHCVSGNSLTEGDYPVRMAIPHPVNPQQNMYYLINLPDARRRLLYEYSIERDQAVRLREISERTLSTLLRQQHSLTASEILMLTQLTPQIVSQFAADYFEIVPNQFLVSANQEGAANGEGYSVYAGLCSLLVRVGTQDAAPALEKLARSGKLGLVADGLTRDTPVLNGANLPGDNLRPMPLDARYRPGEKGSRFDVAWIAALAIAQRDPWADVDQWLAGLLDERTPLTDTSQPPDVGATAAALLLDRQGESPYLFGLESAGETATERFRFVGFRFQSESDRQNVKAWWAKQKSLTQMSPSLAP